jgi:peroxiredoxin
MVATNSAMVPLGTPAADFSLTDVVSGELVTRACFAGQPLLVMFICNHCPYVQFIRSALAQVTNDYLQRGVAVVGISSNDATTQPADGPQAMAEEARSVGYRFQYLYDEEQAVALAYRAACTPDFFLFDAQHRLFYRGQFCAARRKLQPLQIPTGADLTAAVEALLGGAPPPQPQRASIGCNIKWRADREPDYFAGLIVK